MQEQLNLFESFGNQIDQSNHDTLSKHAHDKLLVNPPTKVDIFQEDLQDTDGNWEITENEIKSIELFYGNYLNDYITYWNEELEVEADTDFMDNIDYKGEDLLYTTYYSVNIKTVRGLEFDFYYSDRENYQGPTVDLTWSYKNHSETLELESDDFQSVPNQMFDEFIETLADVINEKISPEKIMALSESFENQISNTTQDSIKKNSEKKIRTVEPNSTHVMYNNTFQITNDFCTGRYDENDSYKKVAEDVWNVWNDENEEILRTLQLKYNSGITDYIRTYQEMWNNTNFDEITLDLIDQGEIDNVEELIITIVTMRGMCIKIMISDASDSYIQIGDSGGKLFIDEYDDGTFEEYNLIDFIYDRDFKNFVLALSKLITDYSVFDERINHILLFGKPINESFGNQISNINTENIGHQNFDPRDELVEMILDNEDVCYHKLSGAYIVTSENLYNKHIQGKQIEFDNSRVLDSYVSGVSLHLCNKSIFVCCTSTICINTYKKKDCRGKRISLSGIHSTMDWDDLSDSEKMLVYSEIRKELESRK